MICGHGHVESVARVAEILSHEHGGLLANEEGGRVGVAADVVRADGEVGDLETLDAVDVESLVEHAVLDDAVALPGRHGAGSEAVPGGLDVALDPLLDRRDVLLAVLELLADVRLVGVEDLRAGLPVALGEGRRPASVADAGGEVAGEGVLLGGGKVKVMSAGWAVVAEEGVLFL